MTDDRRIDDKSWNKVLEKSISLKKDSSESTTYMSPPEQLVSSNIEHLASLLAAVKEHQRKKDAKTHKINPLLIHYISRLLAMSRESVENLGMSTSDISTPDIESSSGENVSMNVVRPTSPHNITQIQSDQTSNGDVTDILLRNVRQKTDILPCSCKKPCSGKAQHIPGTSTPQQEEPAQPTPSGTKDDQHLDISTPSFESRLKNMSLDEYKAMKFPEILPEYSERCTRISNLAKRIEQIRKEQRRLMNNISESSESGQDYDSTRYISPPESVTVMTRLGRKSSADMNGGKENIAPCGTCHDGKVNLRDREQQNSTRLKHLSDQGMVHSSQSIYFTPPESPTNILDNRNVSSSQSKQGLGPPAQPSHHVPTTSHEDGLQLSGDRTLPPQPSAVNQSNQDMSDVVSGTRLQGVCGLCPQNSVRRCDPNKCLVLREPRPHTRPPSSSVRRNFQSGKDDISIKELSTIIEGDSSFASNKEREQHASPANTSSDSIPDVLSEMLSRKLITSPPSWLHSWQDNSSSPTPDSTSHNSGGSDGYVDANFFTYLGQKTEELFQILKEGSRNKTTNIDLPRLIINVFSRLGKNPSEIDIDLAFKKIGLRWFPNNENQINHPILTFRHIDVTTKNFKDLVYKFFKGLTLDSPLQEIENAFQNIGIVCPDASLRRNSNGKSVSFSPSTVDNSSDGYNASTSSGSAVLPSVPTPISISSFSPSTVGNSSGSYDTSTSTGSALFPLIPTSVSVSTEDLSLSQDTETFSGKK